MARLALAALLAGCGGAPAPAAAPPAPAAEANGVDTEAYAELSEFFARKQPHVTQCYNNAFADVEPARRGRGYVALTMEVTPAGRAENVRVGESTLGSQAVERCVVDLVSRWALPRPAERMAFTFSYEFRPE
jgi:TonB family protein